MKDFEGIRVEQEKEKPSFINFLMDVENRLSVCQLQKFIDAVLEKPDYYKDSIEINKDINRVKTFFDGIIAVLHIAAERVDLQKQCIQMVDQYFNASEEEKPESELNIHRILGEIMLSATIVNEAFRVCPAIKESFIAGFSAETFPEISIEEWKSIKEGDKVQESFQDTMKQWVTIIRGTYITTEPHNEENIPKLQGIPFEKNYFVNCKAENQLKTISAAAAAMPDKPYTVPVAVANKGKVSQVCIDCTLSFDYDKNLIPRKITEFDRSVLNAVATLYVYGEQPSIEITPEMIFRTMNGIKDCQKPSKESIDAVTESIDRLRRTYVIIDFSEEAKYRKLHTTECRMEDYLISAEKRTVKAGGILKTSYEMHTVPLLYRYASTVNKQILSIAPNVLDVREIESGQPKKRISNTPRRVAIKTYIIRRIEIMKGATDQSNRILYDSIQEAIDLPAPSRTEKNRIRDYTEQVLIYQQSIGNIHGFKAAKKGRSIIGVDIEF